MRHGMAPMDLLPSEQERVLGDRDPCTRYLCISD